MKLKLANATFKDSRFFYDLRNDADNRKNFLNSEKISFDHHNKWFRHSLKKKSNFFFKILINKSQKCGYLRIKKKKDTFDVSICVQREFRKKDIASLALLLVEKKLNWSKNFTSTVKKNNNASKLLFLKVGYTIHKERKNFIYMKKKITAIKIINKIETIRKKNNTNWMDLLRIAYKKSPKESAIIMSRIYQDDAKISKLVKKLIKS